MAKKNLAEILVDTLVAAGVKRVYGLAGNSLNGITDAIRTDERIKWIQGTNLFADMLSSSYLSCS